MRKAWSFLKRDFLIQTSYRTAFAMQLSSIVLWVPICYFIGKGVSGEGSQRFAQYGGNYFAFMLIGLGLLGYLAISLRTFGEVIRESQLMGTLEIVLLSPTTITQLLLYSSLWIFLFATFRFVLYLLLGTVFGLNLSQGNAVSALVVLTVSIPAFAAFGVVGAALILLIKRGDALNMLMSTGSFVLGGVMFPISTLPEWLQPLSQFLPITHSLEAMRLALFQGLTVIELAPHLLKLALFAFVLLPLSLVTFWFAVRATKASGTLSQY